MKLYNEKGEWSDELLAACAAAKPPLVPNQHPEVLAQPTAPYPVGQEIALKLRPDYKRPEPEPKPEPTPEPAEPVRELMKPIVVSLAAGPEFQAKADRLEASAAAAGLVAKIVREPNAYARGVDAWKRKPELMLWFLQYGPVLWVDADTVLHRDPELEKLADGYDLAAFYSRPDLGIVEDGVVYAAQTDRAKLALMVWQRAVENPAVEWTNLELGKCLRVSNASVLALPPEYCWNPEWLMEERYGPRLPVIEPNAR